MNFTERITAVGAGTWYLQYEVALAEVTRHFRSRYGVKEITTVVYQLRFKSPSEVKWNKREFATEMDRTTFVEKAFSELNLDPVVEAKLTAYAHFLSSIVGERLSAVTFVMDYVQIQFDGHYFTNYAWPIVFVDRRRFIQSDSTYRNALCSLIAKRVSRFEEYLDAGLVFEFEDSSSLEMPTSTQDETLVEYINYNGPDGTWNVWC